MNTSVNIVQKTKAVQNSADRSVQLDRTLLDCICSIHSFLLLLIRVHGIAHTCSPWMSQNTGMVKIAEECV